VPTAKAERFSEAVAALPPQERVRVVYHRVRKGDTLGGIADKYGISVTALRSANKVRGSIIHPGQDLLIAAAPRGADLSRTLSASASERFDDDATPVRRTASTRHVVRRGETLWSIARRHGTTMDRLAKINGLKHDSTLSVGQVLSLPSAQTLASTDASHVSQSVTYVVRSGDTLSRIATKFRVGLNDLLGWNDLSKRSVIKPGQRLVMYVDGRRAGI
jgi:membrane-bound lytic murein transglycosylase D